MITGSNKTDKIRHARGGDSRSLFPTLTAKMAAQWGVFLTKNECVFIRIRGITFVPKNAFFLRMGAQICWHSHMPAKNAPKCAIRKMRRMAENAHDNKWHAPKNARKFYALMTYVIKKLI